MMAKQKNSFAEIVLKVGDTGISWNAEFIIDSFIIIVESDFDRLEVRSVDIVMSGMVV